MKYLTSVLSVSEKFKLVGSLKRRWRGSIVASRPSAQLGSWGKLEQKRFISEELSARGVFTTSMLNVKNMFLSYVENWRRKKSKLSAMRRGCTASMFNVKKRILSEEGFHNRFLLFINDQFQKKIVETFSEEGFHNIYASFFPWGEENYHSEWAVFLSSV